MIASNRTMWDLSVYNAKNELVLIVELKTKLNTVSSWVTQFRRNLFAHNEIPKTSYFLMAFPDTFYLWTEKDLQQWETEPTYIIDANPILNPYFEKMGISKEKMTEQSFALIMFTWLSAIINIPQSPEILDSSQKWLIESGLYSAIVDGNLLHEVMV